MDNRVTVYHAIPLCRKCTSDLSRIQTAAERAGTGTRVTLSIWNRLKFGLKLLSNPVVVIDNKPFSVLGAFREEALIAELNGKSSSL